MEEVIFWGRVLVIAPLHGFLNITLLATTFVIALEFFLLILSLLMKRRFIATLKPFLIARFLGFFCGILLYKGMKYIFVSWLSFPQYRLALYVYVGTNLFLAFGFLKYLPVYLKESYIKFYKYKHPLDEIKEYQETYSKIPK